MGESHNKFVTLNKYGCKGKIISLISRLLMSFLHLFKTGFKGHTQRSPLLNTKAYAQKEEEQNIHPTALLCGGLMYYNKSKKLLLYHRHHHQ